MKTLWAIGLLLFITSTLLRADVLDIKKDVPEIYVVEKGDTLWDISSTFLHSPWKWQDIWHNNPEVENPHLIYPGDKLALIDVDGKRKLTIIGRGPVKISSLGDGRLKPQVRTSPIDNAIPAIPIDKIAVFLSKSRIETPETLNSSPYVIAGEGRRIISGKDDIIYARGEFDETKNIYGVYRPGEVFEHPETEEFLGVQALSIGSARVMDSNADVKTLEVTRTSEEVRVNDRLLPELDYKASANFYPKLPNAEIEAEIIAVEGGVSQVGTLDIVVISAGSRESLEKGDVLAIEQRGEVVKDQITDDLIQLPNVDAGLMIVFRVFEKMSYGLVVSADMPLVTGDIVKNPK
jgi:LysM repeat protein